MHRRFSWSVLTILPLALALTAQPAAPRTPGSAPGEQNQQQHMTNADVIRLVREHQPEAEIIRKIKTTIQSGVADFDLSPNALIALHSAGVSNDVLRVMMADGGVKGGGSNPAGGPAGAVSSDGGTGPSGDANGATLPGTPGNAHKPTPEESRRMLAKLKERPGHSGQITTNPQAAQTETAALAALTQQNQGLGQPRQLLGATPGTTSGSSNPTGGSTGSTPPAGGAGTDPATGQPGSSNPGTSGTPGGQPGMAGPTPRRTASVATQPRSSVTLTPSAAPPKPSSGIPAAIPKGSSLNPCVVGSAPVVTGVTGNRIGLNAFSQDPTWNPYTIAGCNFGRNQGRAFLGLPSGTKFTDLAINSWTDTQIQVTVAPNLLDVLDQDNITLTIVASSGQQTPKSGLKFYAMRREMLLQEIPKSEVALAAVRDSRGLGVVPYYSSPFWGLGYSTALQTGVPRNVADAEVNNADKSMTSGVDRNAWSRFSGGSDIFDFTKLKPGFYVSRFQIDGRNLQICLNPISMSIAVPTETDYQDGSWNAQLYVAQSQIHVNWQEGHCHISDGGTDSSNSTYGLNVWVKGPAIRPTGNPWQEGLK